MIPHLRRALLAGLTLLPGAVAAGFTWWQRGVPRDIPGAATWHPAHDGPLDPTGLYADEVAATLQRLREDQRT